MPPLNICHHNSHPIIGKTAPAHRAGASFHLTKTMDDEPKRKRTDQTWESWIEEKIRAAQEQGQFDNLPGAGKPLPDRRNPFLPADRQIAYDLLQGSGHTLGWIDDANETDRRLAAARQRLRQDHAWYQQALANAAPAQRPALDAAWERHRQTFAQELAAINRLIDDFNLKAPLGQLHKLRLILADELATLPPP